MRQIIRSICMWLERIDPCAHRRVKGLRLVTTYGIALGLCSMRDVTSILPGRASLGTVAAGIALWASVSEARSTRPQSSRDLMLLCVAGAAGAIVFALISPLLASSDFKAWRLGRGEWVLLTGAFLAGWLRKYGTLGAGIGSQIYIGELIGYSAGLSLHDLPEIFAALLVAVIAAVVPRLLTGTSQESVVLPRLSTTPLAGRRLSSEAVMGLQSTSAAAVVLVLNSVFGLVEPVWAITACVYGVAATSPGTVDRLRRRVVGTLVGVPLGLACLPIGAHAPLLIWAVVAISLIVYAMALPDRYDVACGAFAFALISTLALSGEHSITILISRAWETLLGAALALLMAVVVFPLHSQGDAGSHWKGAKKEKATF